MFDLPLKRVAILTSHFTTGDAVSNDAIGMYHAFRKRGIDARMFAGGWDPSEQQFFPVEEVGSFLESSADLLIYHFSIEWTPGLKLLNELKCCRAIKYHNVTPPEFFTGISLWHGEKCREGREQFRQIARMGCDIYLADSEYNRQDLLNEGAAAERCFVVPPFHHTDRLLEIEGAISVLDGYRDGRKIVLMVGRIAPNKGHAALIEAFATYYHNYNRNCRLVIVGKEEAAFAAYAEPLHKLTKKLMAEEAVSFTGEASDSELKAFYLLASVFAIASEHEGFCVPLVEAMAMKVPVVAYASSAIPATLGDAGFLLEEGSPYLLAAAIDRLLSDEDLNVALGIKGWQRYLNRFTSEKIEEELFKALGKANGD